MTIHLLGSVLFSFKNSNSISINFKIQSEKSIRVKHVTATDLTSLFNILAWYNFAVPQRIRLMGRHRLCQQAACPFLDIKVFASASLDAEE